MFSSLSKMILDARKIENDRMATEAHDPHRRGVITSPRATRRDGATVEPIIRNFW